MIMIVLSIWLIGIVLIAVTFPFVNRRRHFIQRTNRFDDTGTQFLLVLFLWPIALGIFLGVKGFIMYCDYAMPLKKREDK